MDEKLIFGLIELVEIFLLFPFLSASGDSPKAEIRSEKSSSSVVVKSALGMGLSWSLLRSLLEDGCEDFKSYY